MNDEPLDDDALRALAIFPLPGTVWFPGTPLALHVFEPRYRALTADALAGSRAFAVPLLEPGFEEDYDGTPPVRPIAGAGRIVQEQALPGGRWNLLLTGVCRVRLEEETRAVPYRVARASAIPDAYPTGGPDALRSEVATLLSAVASVVSALRDSDAHYSLGVAASMPPGRLADVIAHRLIAEPDARQEVLEAIDVRERIALVTRAVSARLAALPQRGTLQ